MRLLKYLNDSRNSVAILLAVAVLSMSYPYGFPLFGLLAFFFCILKIFTGRFKSRINIGFILFSLSVVVYILGMALSQGLIYSNNISDVTNIISFFIIWALLSDLNKDYYPELVHKFAKYAVAVSFAVSLISLYKFYMLLGNIQLPQFFVGDYYPSGTTLVRDYNMFSFALITGLIMSVYLLEKTKKMSHMFYYLIAFISIFSSVIFAGSRRAWIVAVIVAVFVIFIVLKSLHRFEKNFIKIVKFGLITGFSALSIFLFMTLFNIEVDFQSSAQIQDLQYRLETLQFDQAEESLSPRTDRWQYATQMFGDSNLVQLFIGSGFSYLTEFAQTFSPDLNEDYPHNPFLSTLLYSGLFGVILLTALLICSMFFAIKNYKVVGIHYTFLYFIAYIFILVSSNSIFSNALFVSILLLILSIPKTTHPQM
ncbi:O-antigen ligase family protein [Oceanobacillus profundus]|uniref:O-antigen ligase family protein n=1 Tax=Oceanobacillus profundus TaxID=372463 RepID=UPI00362E185F